jgi:hypothetical protein
METGDVAYPVTYWTETEPPPNRLHQPWCREMWWFADPESGKPAWSIANDVWDFDLAPWIAQGRLAWADLDADPPRLIREDLQFLLGLRGERRPQQFSGGERVFLEPPDGNPVVPFGEADDAECPPLTPEEEAALQPGDDELRGRA